MKGRNSVSKYYLCKI